MAPILLVAALAVIAVAGNAAIYRTVGHALRERVASPIGTGKDLSGVLLTLWSFEMLLALLAPLTLIMCVMTRIISTDDTLFLAAAAVLCIIYLPLLIYAVLYWALIFPLKRFERWRYFMTATATAASLFAAGALIYGATVGVRRIEVKRLDLAFERLPYCFEGIRIVQISDLHLGSIRHYPSLLPDIIDAVNHLKPDVVLFTGDLVNSRSAEAGPFVHELKKIHARFGVYAVMGNHDYGYYHPWKSDDERLADVETLQGYEAEAGWQMLNNDCAFIRVGIDSIAIAGVENWGEKHFGQQGRLDQALAAIPDSMFTILMTHNPLHWRAEVLPESRVDLTLSGHTHAMQFEVAGRSPSAWFYPEWSGLYAEGDRRLYVNVGLGFVGYPIRIGARPEITLFTLTHKDDIEQ
jgi:predicted MPP superfamily phosphohydrolase